MHCAILKMNRGRMDLHILEILLAFKKYGTLSSTAEALHISQPTLTRNMQALEKEVDVPIFIHGKNSLKLNENGEFLVKESEKLLHSYDEMIQNLHLLDDSLRVIHIGYSAPGPKVVYESFIQSYYPTSKIIWTSNDHENELLEGLSKHTYDFIFIQKQTVSKDLYSKSCLKEQLFTCVEKDHPFMKYKNGITFEQMDGHTYLQIEDVGIWKDIKAKNMPHSKIITQKDREDLTALINSSSLPCFVSNITNESNRRYPNRIRIPIIDPDATREFIIVTPRKSISLFSKFLSEVKKIK